MLFVVFVISEEVFILLNFCKEKFFIFVKILLCKFFLNFIEILDVR